MLLPHALRTVAEDSLFAAMPEALATDLKARATLRTVGRGGVVVRQGQAADRLLIPVDGPLRLVARTRDGSTTTQLSPRRSLNLEQVLRGGVWDYTAIADGETHVIEIDGNILRERLAGHPVFARYLERITGSRSLREAANTLRLGGLAPRSVQRLFSALEEHRLAMGAVMPHGSTSPWVVVVAGRVALCREDDGEAVELTILEPGEFYGGGAAQGRSASLQMRAAADAAVLAITAPRLASLCAEDAALGRVLRLEHPEVQRRVRRAFTEAGEGFTEFMFADPAPAGAEVPGLDHGPPSSPVVGEQGARPPRVPTSVPVGATSEPSAPGVGAASAPQLGRPWGPPPLRARRLDGFRCSLAEDSGAAALASLLKYVDRPATFASVRRSLQRRSPPSLLDLAQVAERQGLMTHAAKLGDPRDLRQLRAPFLLAVGDRFVLVHEVHARRIRAFDPLSGLREISMAELRRTWSGATLTFRDARAFLGELAGPDSASAEREVTRAARPRSRGRRATYFRLFGDVHGALVAALVVSVAVLALSILSPRLNGLVVDQVLAYGDLELLSVVALGLVLIHVSTFALSGFRDLCLSYLGGVMEHRLSSLMLRHTLGIALEAHGDDRVGGALSRMGELMRIRTALSTDIITIILQVAQGVVYLILVLTYSIKLGLIILAAVPTSALIIRIIGRRYRARYLALFDEATRMQSETTEQVEQVATIKALGGGVAAQKRWEHTLAAKIGVERQLVGLQAIMQAALKVIEEGVKIAGLYFGVRMVLGGDLSPGGLLAVTQYVNGSLGPLVGLAGKLDELEQVGISLRKLDELFEHPLEDEDAAAVRSEIPFEGAITARDLTFAYGPDTPPVLRGVSFTITPGQTIAIVGRSGSGKTTLAKLIHGALRPTAGELAFDDQDSRGLPLPIIRRSVGIVLQESQLFAGTILENIAYGDDRPDESRAREAARLAAAHEFIMALPARYSTYLAEGGLGLSGGQRQRVCIARALYRSPRILVLDEATSALDAESERAILANMRDIIRGRSAILIAHRLNTVKHADRILVLDEGMLIEAGTHDELMAQRGLYHALFGQQFHQH